MPTLALLSVAALAGASALGGKSGRNEAHDGAGEPQAPAAGRPTGSRALPIGELIRLAAPHASSLPPQAGREAPGGGAANPEDVIKMALPEVSSPRPGTRPRWARSWEKGEAWARERLGEASSRYDPSQPLSALHPKDQQVLLDNLMGLPSLDVLEGRLRPGLLYHVRPLLVRQVHELGRTADGKLKESLTADQRAFWSGVRDYLALCRGTMTAPAAMRDAERFVDDVEAALVREWLRRRRAGGSAGSRARSSAPSWIELSPDLFQESGHNATEEVVARGYAEAMRDMGGWGDFPPISAWIGTVDEEDLEKYQEAEEGGYEHELAWSRPLRRADLGKDYAKIVDGHHRAHAARAISAPLRVEPLSWGPSGARPWTTQELEAFRTGHAAIKRPR